MKYYSSDSKKLSEQKPTEHQDKLAACTILETKIRHMLADAFKTFVLNDDTSEEDLQKLVVAYGAFKQGAAALEKAKQKRAELQKVELEQKKLGSLVIGEQGQKDFGPFRLVWKVQMDHIEWFLNDSEDPHESWLTGALKYVGWNRIEMGSELSLEQQLANEKKFAGTSLKAEPPSFQVYVHEWPALKEALDFLYYDLGRKSAKESGYENSFMDPGI